MNTVLGLILLICITVDGEIKPCFVGGITQSDCQPLISGSVLQKLYISCLLKNTKSSKNKEGNTDQNSLTPSLKSSSSMSLKFGIKRSPNMCDKMLDMSMFDIKVNEEPESAKNIERYWKYVLSKGTDMYSLKFHTKLVTIFKANSYFSVSDIKVFLESGYNAASTYYLTKNYSIANGVLEYGLNYIKTGLSSIIPMKMYIEYSTWEVLYYTLQVDVLNNMGIIEPLKLELPFAEKKLEQLINGEYKYPSSYVLQYRGYLLDENFNKQKKVEMDKPIKTGLLLLDDNHTKHEYVLVYNDLLLSFVDRKDEQFKGLAAFKNLVKAILRPVFSTEERLLNFQANMLAKEKVKDCINENGWIHETNDLFCKQLEKMRDLKSVDWDSHTNHILNSFIREYMYTNILEKLKFNIDRNINSNENIDENILHIIVTESIDMDPIIRRLKIETLKEAIKILEKFIDENYKNHPKNNDVDKKEDESVEKINSMARIKSVVTVYKWLAEMHGILCDGIQSKDQISLSNKALESALDKAYDLSKKQNAAGHSNLATDDHLQYLKAKYQCRMAFSFKSWEVNFRPDGWILEKYKMLASIVNLTSNRVDDCFSQMTYHTTTLNHPFISYSEVHINLYRYYMEYNKYDEASDHVKKAFSNSVISSADRYRNKEAHELYSMLLVMHNPNDAGPVNTEIKKKKRSIEHR